MMLDHIARHSDDPGLDAESLARRFRCSERYVHRLFVATGRSVGEHVGHCFCGAVTIEVTGEPAAMGYCHCRSCRSWSGGPVNAFSLWKPEAVRITEGAQHVETFAKTPLSQRKYCRKCGGHLMKEAAE